MSKKFIQFVDGPNLNMLGEREPEIYGSMTLDEVHKNVRDYIAQNYKEIDVNFFQSNSEGDIVDCLLYTSPSPRDVEESRMPSSA